MKLLLTSGGLRNKSLEQAFLTMAGVAVHDIRVAVIPTAMNTESGDKGWFITHLTRFQQLGVTSLDIVDISALPTDIWLPRLEAADVIFVGGGNTKHLMEWITKSGLEDSLQRLLETRLYVGVSAGSYVTTPQIRTNIHGNEETFAGLGYTNFGLIAHYKNPAFPRAQTRELVEQRAAEYDSPVYVLDDNSAVQVIDDSVTIISEGEYLLLNQ